MALEAITINTSGAIMSQSGKHCVTGTLTAVSIPTTDLLICAFGACGHDGFAAFPMALLHDMLCYATGGERSEGKEDGDDEGDQEATGAERKPRQKAENGQGGVREGIMCVHCHPYWPQTGHILTGPILVLTEEACYYTQKYTQK